MKQKFIEKYGYDPSLYHLSDYSFNQDLLYLGRFHFYFFVVPGNKGKAFMGNTKAAYHNLPRHESSLILGNTSTVLLIGMAYRNEVDNIALLDLE